ncbi:FAD-binding oxidoreductase, partial [Propionibacterium freudenreichii]|nr:FAD-binding oxidoreductase [Propionibacterium freudenreichii]
MSASVQSIPVNELSDRVDALRRELGSDDCLDTSTLTRALYSTDASVYRVVPTVVATPADTDQLRHVVQAALAVGLPITGRGA